MTFLRLHYSDLVVGGGLDVLQVDGPQLAQDEGVEQAEQGVNQSSPGHLGLSQQSLGEVFFSGLIIKKIFSI